MVIDDDEFPVLAEFEDIFRLVDQRLNAGAETILFVAGGNDDGQLDQWLGLGLVVH